MRLPQVERTAIIGKNIGGTFMKAFRIALTATTASLALAGCGAGITPGQIATQPGQAAQTLGRVATPAQQLAGASAILPRLESSPDRRGSWMAPGTTTSSSLLYVADENTNDVYVYAYPQGKLEGTLTGFNTPVGMCSDRSGNVYVLNGNGTSATVYAHGGTTPIGSLGLAGYPGLSCSVDPKTGNFAVGSFDGTNCAECPGFINIYPKGSSIPVTYQPSGQIGDLAGCAYDNHGNLFCDGYSRLGRKFILFELPAGSTTVNTVTVNSTSIKSGPMQWDGKYLAVGSGASGTIYQIAISASGGTVAGTTTLNNTGWVWQSWILHTQGGKKVPQGTRIIAPTVIGSNQNYVGYWNYPAGGTATKTITGFSAPTGATVSTIKP